MRHILTTCILLGAVSFVGAEPLKLGPLKIRPHIDQTMTYSDNIFISSNNRIGAFSFNTIPGIDLQAGETELFQFDANYNFTKGFYIDQTNQDYIGHNLGLNISSVMNRVKLGAGLNYNFTTDANTLVGDRVQGGNLGSVVNGMFVVGPKIGISSYWNHNQNDFTSNSIIDNNSDVAGGAVNFALDELTSFNVYGSWTQNSVGRGDNITGFSAGVGVNRTFNSVFSAFLSAGYTENGIVSLAQEDTVFEGINYTEAQGTQLSRLGTTNNSRGATFSGGFKATTGRLETSLNGTVLVGDNQNSNGSDNSNQSFIASLVSSYEVGPSTKLNLTGSRSINTSITEIDNTYYASSVNLSATHNFTDRFSITAGGGYMNLDFTQPVQIGFGQTTQRNDDLFTANINLVYNWTSWLRSYASYNYQTNDSSVSSLSFDENRFTIGVGASF